MRLLPFWHATWKSEFPQRSPGVSVFDGRWGRQDCHAGKLLQIDQAWTKESWLPIFWYTVYILYIYISSRVTTIEIKMGKAPAHAFRQACNSHSGVFPVMSYSWSFPTGRHCSITVPSTVKTVEILFARKRLELPWLQCFFRSGKSW